MCIRDRTTVWYFVWWELARSKCYMNSKTHAHLQITTMRHSEHLTRYMSSVGRAQRKPLSWAAQLVVYGRKVMSTSLLEVSLLGVGTMLSLERDPWSMVKRLRQATNEYAHPPIVA